MFCLECMIDGRRIAILVEEGFEDSELTEPIRAMTDAGARVVAVGTGSRRTYRGKRGRAEVLAEVDAGDVNAAIFDAVIVPGGDSASRLCLCAPILELVREVHGRGRIIAAVCQGPRVLISAGILKGRRVTSHPRMAEDLQKAGARWTDAPVVKDGNIITSRKPADLPRFSKAIIDALKGQPLSISATVT